MQLNSCIIKISNRSQVNKSNENHYPSEDTEKIVADVRSIPGQAQAKLAYFVEHGGWLWPDICTK
jgi:hypothetical protein